MTKRKTYDIIMISNILDWAHNDSERLKIAKDNLLGLLKNEGTVICSSLVRNSESSFETERDIFDDEFTYNGNPTGYTYTRKK